MKSQICINSTHLLSLAMKHVGAKSQSRMQKESTEYGNKFRNLDPNHKVQQWRTFPPSQRIKTRQAKLRDKVVFVACEAECNQFSSEDAFTPPPGGGRGGVGKGESHMKGAGCLSSHLGV